MSAASQPARLPYRMPHRSNTRSVASIPKHPGTNRTANSENPPAMRNTIAAHQYGSGGFCSLICPSSTGTSHGFTAIGGASQSGASRTTPGRSTAGGTRTRAAAQGQPDDAIVRAGSATRASWLVTRSGPPRNNRNATPDNPASTAIFARQLTGRKCKRAGAAGQSCISETGRDREKDFYMAPRVEPPANVRRQRVRAASRSRAHAASSTSSGGSRGSS